MLPDGANQEMTSLTDRLATVALSRIMNPAANMLICRGMSSLWLTPEFAFLAAHDSPDVAFMPPEQQATH